MKLTQIDLPILYLAFSMKTCHFFADPEMQRYKECAKNKCTYMYSASASLNIRTANRMIKFVGLSVLGPSVGQCAIISLKEKEIALPSSMLLPEHMFLF